MKIFWFAGLATVFIGMAGSSFSGWSFAAGWASLATIYAALAGSKRAR